jgi:hypothetical protein
MRCLFTVDTSTRETMTPVLQDEGLQAISWRVQLKCPLVDDSLHSIVTAFCHLHHILDQTP